MGPGGGRARRALAWLASVPRTVARLGSQTISMPRPRTLVVALGIDGEELERGITDALVQTPDPPEQVLVVTDSAAIGVLRRLGVAVEQVPAAGGRQAELAGGAYEAFLRRRLGWFSPTAPAFGAPWRSATFPATSWPRRPQRPRRRDRLLR